MRIFKPNIEKMKEKRDVRGLLKALSHHDRHVRRDAAEALKSVGPDAKEAILVLIQKLQDREDETRMYAAEVLGKIRDERSVEPLIKALSDNAPSVRYSATEALGAIGDSRAVIPLIGVLRNDVKEWVRNRAAHALGAIGDKRAVEPLTQALKDPSKFVRSAAAESLYRMRELPKLEEIEKFCGKHGVVNVRGFACDLYELFRALDILHISESTSLSPHDIHNMMKYLSEEGLSPQDINNMIEYLSEKGMVEGGPKCSICGRIITRHSTSIAEDIRRRGGVVVGEPSLLDSAMYKCTVCPACGSAFCLECQKPRADPCPKCGESNLQPGFADLVHRYYRL